ncbi:CYTH domain-containing protein [Neobacillus sp. YX16]|uniref:CYTH domain-containing protein n=1 Tax=Neobacillus sp. YX16 TaxID=3047874 RepID=UPI0024C2FF62|nr:CYTH domain-containing protein [Neobacillus sp. YX16]WHZ04546.1 CYTH domain-containing protein [Neobacillus sp. YX16]
MSETIEIEFKNLLTKVEYENLLKTFNVKEKDIVMQSNHYFDTPEFALKNLGSALRIREKKNNFELTLKQPAAVGLLETTQLLSANEFKAAIQQQIFPKGIVQERIEQLKIAFNKIVYFGSLTTKRAEFPYKEGLLVLDHSFYLNKEDYEIEYEVEDFQSGQLVFQGLLKQYEIPIRKTQNKIARFYQQKL